MSNDELNKEMLGLLECLVDIIENCADEEIYEHRDVREAKDLIRKLRRLT